MTPSRKFVIFIFVVGIFAAGLCQGFTIALKKPLWNDEIFSQVSSVEGKSWPVIWTGRIGEGNNSPLFYSIQKAICKAFNYRSEDLWHKDDIRARFILRIAPVFCMSLGMALIAWFLCVYYSLLGGLIGFIVSISSYMVWYYWAEARPYALIFLAATVQALALFYYCRFEKKLSFWGMMAANLFVAFAFSLSVIQIVASGVMLWVKGYRRIWPLLLSVGLPLGVAFGYHIAAPHYSFFFGPYGKPYQLIFANIPSGRLAAFFIFPALVLGWDWYIKKERKIALWPFFAWAWLTFFGYIAFIGYLKYLTLFQESPQFEVSNRYFMALTPLGIIAVSVGILELVKRPRALWARAMVWAVALAIILPRLAKAFHWMMNGL
ncbi:MAG TPA: hypothetical protein PL155_05420 [Candidatus Omnitrophota bacterium]|nr:hypothetical protein [Candidatus Omnitrophota bacterium]HPD84079.1 hypothetical protein [Candidatus Omnitrophota bacterium]HRZ02936.1 hypothetical protein [Candidatus Omnitrophota bacterium]